MALNDKNPRLKMVIRREVVCSSKETFDTEERQEHRFTLVAKSVQWLFEMNKTYLVRANEANV